MDTIRTDKLNENRIINENSLKTSSQNTSIKLPIMYVLSTYLGF